jgi:hypothetical protein
MTCNTCTLPLNIHTRKRGLPDCHICRRNRTARERERVNNRTARIVGQAMAKLLGAAT